VDEENVQGNITPKTGKEELNEEESSPLQKTPSSSPKKASKKSKVDSIEQGSTTSLFEAVKKHAAIAVVIEDWIKSYSKDKVQAITALINFIIEVNIINVHANHCSHVDVPTLLLLICLRTKESILF
jgi:hypothetical protein